MNRILIYSPELEGHPRLYCRVICGAIPEGSATIVLAVGENERATIADSVDIQPLLQRSDISIVRTNDVSTTGSNHLTAEEICSLQAEYKINKTVFIEADKLVDQTWRIATGMAPRFVGATYAIFAKTSEWYPGEDFFTGEKKRIIAKSLRTTLGNIKRTIFDRTKSAKYFYVDTLLKKSIVDFLITKDERLAEKRIPRVIWMPEISRTKIESIDVATTEDDLLRKRQLEVFKSQHLDKKLVLYFGDAAFYKGYDLFLELLRRNPDLVGIHPGRLCDEEQQKHYHYETATIRNDLRQQRRLMETGCYVSSEYQKRLYFSSVNVYATTHRLTLSSSTMFQAVELGRPVLVPNRGLLGYRVAKNGLGDTYRYGDIDDLYLKLVKLLSRPSTNYSSALQRFTALHSSQAIDKFWQSLLLSTPLESHGE